MLRLPARRPSRRFTLGMLAVAVLLVPGWFLLRDSPLVSVDKVNITGVSGPQAAEISQALTDAAKRMTTLDVDQAQLADAVHEFPVVARIKAHGRLLHTLDIQVSERLPVAALANRDRRMAVASDGTILANTLTKDLPLVPVAAPPGGTMLAEHKAQQMVTMLGAASAELRPHIERASIGDQGLTVRLANGPELYFGDTSRLAAKWAAAERVLADYSARGAAYIDVRVPERPAAGGFDDPTNGATPDQNSQPGVEPPQ